MSQPKAVRAVGLTREQAHPSAGGDADIAAAAALFADPARARVLAALVDGRALPASVLASEAGVSASSASGHLGKLLAAGLVEVEQCGRHRYYRLAGPHVAGALEGLAAIAPAMQVRSLRQGTRAAALRTARTCYDHLAGRLGVTLTQALVDRRVLVPVDGVGSTARRAGAPLSAVTPENPYVLGRGAGDVLAGLGIPADVLDAARRGRPLLRFCLDWSEQQHHVAGALGALLLNRFVAAGWVQRRDRRRDVLLTPAGRVALHDRLGIDPATLTG